MTIIAIASLLGLLAAAGLQIMQVREFEARIKGAFEDGYYQGYADRALGRSRIYRPSATAERSAPQQKTPAEQQLDWGI